MKDRIIELFRKQPEQKYNAGQLTRVLNLHSSEHKTLRQALKELVREGKILVDRSQNFAMRDESRVIKGILKLHADGFGFVVPESAKKQDVFIPKKFINFAMNGDHVLVESYRGESSKKYEGRILRVLQRVHNQVVGTLEKKGGQFFVTLRDAKIGLPEVYIPQKNMGQARVGDLVGVTLEQYPGHGIVAVGLIDHVIGVQTDINSLIEGILFQNEIRQIFSGKIESKMQALPKDPSLDFSDHRKDLRHIPFMTIDGVTAKDFDDAVCVTRHGHDLVLYVGIADVAEYVVKGTELDKEAYARGTSTYLPDRCIPMLPNKLSNGLCSLNPGVPRFTLTAEIHYNSNGDFLRARYYKSLIQSRKRATYEEVEAFFDKTDMGDFGPDLQQSLRLMKELSGLLVQKSQARGTLGFDLPEAYVIYNAQGDITGISKRPKLYSHKLIEEFMVAANVCVAQLLTSLEIGLLYRVHDKPDPNKIQDFLTLVHNLGLAKHLENFEASRFFNETAEHPLSSYLQFAFLRSLKQAQYSPDNLGHFGLNLENYCHFTSPIRRYPDLVVHRQLRHLLEQTQDGVLEFCLDDLEKTHRKVWSSLYSYDELRAAGKHASDRERKSMEAERAVLDLVKVQFAARYLSEEFLGTIVRMGNFGVSVRLEPHFMEGTLPFVEMRDDYYDYDDRKLRLVGRRTRKILKVGDKLRVQILRADLETAQIILSCVPKAGEAKKPTSPSRQKNKNKKKRH